MEAILRTDQQKIHATALQAPVDQLVAPDGVAEQPADRPIVLIVDDEPDVGIILQQLLRPYADIYDIHVATNPADALECIAGGQVHFVITDFNMPGTNGLQLVAAVKRCSPHTPVLLITAYTTSVLEQLARQYQVDYYVTKPFRLKALEQVIRAALTLHAATDG
jgi:two-component system response regulator AtoC